MLKMKDHKRKLLKKVWKKEEYFKKELNKLINFILTTIEHNSDNDFTAMFKSFENLYQKANKALCDWSYQINAIQNLFTTDGVKKVCLLNREFRYKNELNEAHSKGLKILNGLKSCVEKGTQFSIINYEKSLINNNSSNCRVIQSEAAFNYRRILNAYLQLDNSINALKIFSIRLISVGIKTNKLKQSYSDLISDVERKLSFFIILWNSAEKSVRNSFNESYSPSFLNEIIKVLREECEFEFQQA